MSDTDSTPEFETLGTLVDAVDVPLLVLRGRTVWAAGYGDGEDGFDALEQSDLWAWDDLSDGVVASWGPFRVSVNAETDPTPAQQEALDDLSRDDEPEPVDIAAVIAKALTSTVLSDGTILPTDIPVGPYQQAMAQAVLKALEQAGAVVLDACARCGEDPRAHWCADLEETFN